MDHLRAVRFHRPVAAGWRFKREVEKDGKLVDLTESIWPTFFTSTSTSSAKATAPPLLTPSKTYSHLVSAEAKHWANCCPTPSQGRPRRTPRSSRTSSRGRGGGGAESESAAWVRPLGFWDWEFPGILMFFGVIRRGCQKIQMLVGVGWVKVSVWSFGQEINWTSRWRYTWAVGILLILHDIVLGCFVEKIGLLGRSWWVFRGILSCYVWACLVVLF